MARKRKILYVVTKSVWGGAQRYVYDLARNLPRDRFLPVVAAGRSDSLSEPRPEGAGGGPLFDKLRRAWIKTVAVPGLERDIHIIKEARALAQLYRLFKNEKPDIIHLNSSKAGFIGALAAFIYKLTNNQLSVITILTVHGWPYKEDRSFIWRSAVFAASVISARLADVVILITGADFNSARKFLPKRKLAFISNGIESDGALPREEARAFLAEKLGRPIPKESVIFGTVAELTRNKGLYYFISALSRLSLDSRYGGLASIVIGDGEERKNLESRIKNHGLDGKVFLAGFIPDAHRYLAAFDVFVLPSIKEGLPYTVIEAMAAGVPVTASAVGGIPDLIRHGVNGLIAPPGNHLLLAECIGQLLANPAMRAELGIAGKKTVEARFRLRDMVEKTIQLYGAS